MDTISVNGVAVEVVSAGGGALDAGAKAAVEALDRLIREDAAVRKRHPALALSRVVWTPGDDAPFDLVYIDTGSQVPFRGSLGQAAAVDLERGTAVVAASQRHTTQTVNGRAVAIEVRGSNPERAEFGEVLPHESAAEAGALSPEELRVAEALDALIAEHEVSALGQPAAELTSVALDRDAPEERRYRLEYAPGRVVFTGGVGSSDNTVIAPGGNVATVSRRRLGQG